MLLFCHLPPPPSSSLSSQVTRKAAQAFADKHDMVAYIELSAKDIHYLEPFEDVVSALTSHMITCREESERKLMDRVASQNNLLSHTYGRPPRFNIEREWTSTASARSDVIRVGTPIMQEFTSSGSFANDWEVLTAPEDNVPDYVYLEQERRRLEARKCAC